MNNKYLILMDYCNGSSTVITLDEQGAFIDNETEEEIVVGTVDFEIWLHENFGGSEAEYFTCNSIEFK